MPDKLNFTKVCAAILLGSAILFSAPVFADNKAMLELLLLLKDKGSITPQEYNLLLNAARSDSEKIAESERKIEESDKQAGALPKINTSGKLELTSADGQHRFRIGGRLQYDITSVSRDGDYAGSSEHQFRRARLYLSGTTAKFWDFTFKYDFEDLDDDSQGIEDAYIRYTGWPVHVTLGQHKAPYSMMEVTSSKYIAFIERSMASDLFNANNIGVGNKAPGIGLTWNDQKNSGFLLEGGYYFLRQRDDREGSIDEGNLDDNGLSARLVWGQYESKARTLLSAGVSGGFRNYANDTVRRFRVRPGVSAGDRIVSSASSLLAESFTTFNLNAAGMYKNYWVSAEYYDGSFDLTTSGEDGMQGFYVQAGAFLTPGDSRRYKQGAWASVKPKNPVGDGGMGAWEVALRYDGVELDSGLTGDLAQKANTFGVALNWYPISNIRIQANYITTFCDAGECDWDDITNDVDVGEPDFFVLRSQIFF